MGHCVLWEGFDWSVGTELSLLKGRVSVKWLCQVLDHMLIQFTSLIRQKAKQAKKPQTNQIKTPRFFLLTYSVGSAFLVVGWVSKSVQRKMRKPCSWVQGERWAFEASRHCEKLAWLSQSAPPTSSAIFGLYVHPLEASVLEGCKSS